MHHRYTACPELFGSRQAQLAVGLGQFYSLPQTLGEGKISTEMVRCEELTLGEDATFYGLVGESSPMRALYQRLQKVAPTMAPLLIQGETGTGKEVVAHAAHRISSRANRPFVVVDCGCLPTTLLEVDLFGHAKGAFTGAVEHRVGAIESANGGTVFLDEIGEVPLDVQSRLLRVLEDKTIRRLGESSRRGVDVRFIFATHRDLRTMVAEGRFREDLYFRIAVLSVHVPALRDRRDDIPLLAAHFRETSERPIDHATLEVLQRRPWPGNVRELRNVLQRVSALGVEGVGSIPPPRSDPNGPVLCPIPVRSQSAVSIVAAARPGAGGALSFSREEEPVSPLVDGLDFGSDLPSFRESWMSAGERAYLANLMARHDGDVTAAAASAGVNKTYIYRLLRKHGMDRYRKYGREPSNE